MILQYLDEMVDMNILAIMNRDYANEMLKTFPIGIKVRFTHELEKWQNSLDQQHVNASFSQTTNNNEITNKTSTLKSLQSISLLQSSSTDVTFDLGDILKSTATGIMIIDYYKTNVKLNSSIRAMLVDSIISHVITKKIPMSINLADRIGTYIVAMFPSEVKVR